MEVTNLLEFCQRSELRKWLEQNYASAPYCWVASYRGKCPSESVIIDNETRLLCLPYIEIVEEALCFGWIDSTAKRLPDGRLAQRLSPRRKYSHWTELNKQRCRDLEALGLMTDAGRFALMKAK